MAHVHGIPTIPMRGLQGGGGALSIPQVGFGTWQVPEEAVESALAVAFEAGYRHVDTAKLYGNEAGVGRAVRASGIPREEIFVTTKVWNDDHRRVREAFDGSLDRLGLDVLDLCLIHWPVPKQDAFVEAWRELLALRDEGRVRAVGVSNFQIGHLQRLAEETGELPAINQIELHPLLAQQELREFHAEHGIVTQSWSPLARGAMTDHPVVAAIAATHGVTWAQVLIRWHVQLGLVVIPRSVTPGRIRQNLDVFGFALDDADLADLARLDAGRRFGPDPDLF